MDVVLSLHGRIAYAIVLYLAIVGGWGLILGVRGRGPSANFVGALIVAEIAIVAQSVLGLAVVISRGPLQPLHVLYGVALAVALPLAATFTRQRPPRAVSFAFGFMALFAAGLAIRGITTA